MNDLEIRKKRFLEEFGNLNEDELLKKPVIFKYLAYDFGLLKSKIYTKEELENKKTEYLAMLPFPESNKTINRWQHEVERRFKSEEINRCPDKVFLMLDTFRRLGTPS